MGFVRIVLAIAVLLGHAADNSILGFRLLNPAFAVEAFFILSGFYMALVLDRTYNGPGAYSAFMANRALRLYPIYWVVLLITIPVVFTAAQFDWLPADRPPILWNASFLFPQLLDTASILLLVPTHLIMAGQEFVYFFAIDPDGLYDIRSLAARQDAFKSSLPLFAFLMVPQAWSLSFEMIFYAMAPFLGRWRTRWIIALTVLSLAVRGWIYLQPTLEPFTAYTYKFFPAELWTFTTGFVVYRLYRTASARGLMAPRRIAPFAAALVILTLGYAYLAWLPVWVFLPLFAALMPALFAALDMLALRPRWNRVAQVDRLLGDLSYPVYISHILVLQILYTFTPGLTTSLDRVLTPIVVVVTLLASYALLRLVGGPVERIRTRNREFATRRPDRASRRREERRRQESGRRKTR